MEISRKAILEPRDLWWEKGGIFNPAVAEIGRRIFMLYRAVGRDHISRFGLAISENGEDFQRLDKPIYEATEDDRFGRLGVEDPRIVKLGRDYFITYTSASIYPADKAPQTDKTPWRIRTQILRTRDFQDFQSLGVVLKDIDSKDSVLFPEVIGGNYLLLHRISPDVYLSESRDLRRFDGGFSLFGPTENKWESEKVGAAISPIKTDYGWLLLYHGVSKTKTYSVGAVMLHPQNPRLILKRTKEPIIVPEAAWEKRGQVGNVVFPTGHLVRDGELWLYYGAADERIGLIKLSLNTLVEYVMNQ